MRLCIHLFFNFFMHNIWSYFFSSPDSSQILPNPLTQVIFFLSLLKKIKQHKTKSSNKHGAHFLLATHSWERYLPWSVLEITSVTLLKKTNFYSPCGFDCKYVLGLGYDFVLTFPPLYPDFVRLEFGHVLSLLSQSVSGKWSFLEDSHHPLSQPFCLHETGVYWRHLI